MDEQDRCVNPVGRKPDEPCDHLRRHHNTAGCMVTLCKCQEFTEELQDAPPATGARRVCVDVPVGYTLSISLIPVGAFEEAPDG